MKDNSLGVETEFRKMNKEIERLKLREALQAKGMAVIDPPKEAREVATRLVEKLKDCHEQEGGVAWLPFDSIITDTIAAALVERDAEIGRLRMTLPVDAEAKDVASEIVQEFHFTRALTEGSKMMLEERIAAALSKRDARVIKKHKWKDQESLRTRAEQAEAKLEETQCRFS